MQFDLFDQGEAKGAGERQCDLEDIIAFEDSKKEIAMRRFKEESMSLALCTQDEIDAASKAFDEAGDYAAANDIYARYEDYQEDLNYEMQAAMKEFGYA